MMEKTPHNNQHSNSSSNVSNNVSSNTSDASRDGKGDTQFNSQHDESMNSSQKNKTLLKLEELSRIHVNAEDSKDLENDFMSSLKCIEQLNDVDTNGVQDWFYEFTTPLYADEVKQNMPSTNEVLSNTPQKEENKIVVPKFIG